MRRLTVLYHKTVPRVEYSLTHTHIPTPRQNLHHFTMVWPRHELHISIYLITIGLLLSYSTMEAIYNLLSIFYIVHVVCPHLRQHATGAVLSQMRDDDKWHPVAYISKSLNPAEPNYDIYDKEMFAVMRALEQWSHYLEGATHPVQVLTDHKNLEYFMTAQKLNRRQARWSVYLSRFD